MSYLYGYDLLLFILNVMLGGYGGVWDLTETLLLSVLDALLMMLTLLLAFLFTLLSLLRYSRYCTTSYLYCTSWLLFHHPARDGRKEFLAARTFQRNGVLGDVLHEGPAPFAFDANGKGRFFWARIGIAAVWTVLLMLWI